MKAQNKYQQWLNGELFFDSISDIVQQCSLEEQRLIQKRAKELLEELGEIDFRKRRDNFLKAISRTPLKSSKIAYQKDQILSLENLIHKPLKKEDTEIDGVHRSLYFPSDYPIYFRGEPFQILGRIKLHITWFLTGAFQQFLPATAIAENFDRDDNVGIMAFGALKYYEYLLTFSVDHDTPDVKTFGCRLHAERLSKLYNLLDRNELIKGATSQEEFKMVLSEEWDTNTCVIHWNCQTRQIQYLVQGLKPYFANLNPASIERSRKFYSKRAILLKANNLYKTKSKNNFEEQVKDQEVLDIICNSI